MARAKQSHKWEREPKQSGSQGGSARIVYDVAGFSGRLREALGQRTGAEVARAAGIAPQTLDAYLKGAVPSADRAFAIADALGINVRWLIKGEGPPREAGESDAEWLILPRYDLASFDGEHQPEPIEQVRIKRSWVGVRLGAGRLWVTELISHTLGDFGREGDTVLCEDVTPPLQDGRVYIFLFDGRIFVRRVMMRPEFGLSLIESNEMSGFIVAPERLDSLVPVGRILAAVRLDGV